MDLSQEEYESYENGESYQEGGEYNQEEVVEYEGGYEEEYEEGYEEYYEGEEIPELSEEEILEIQNFSASTIQKFVRYYLGQKYYKDLYAKRRWTLVKADIITEHATKGRAKGPGSRRPPTRGKKVVGLAEPTYNNNNNSEGNEEEEGGRQGITKSSSATMGGGMSGIDLSAVKLKKTPVLPRKNAPIETNDDTSLPDSSSEINTTNHNNSSSSLRGRVVRPISVVGLSPIALKTPSTPNPSFSNLKPIETSSPTPPPKPILSPIPPPTPPHPSTLNSPHPPPPPSPSPSPSFPAPFSSPLSPPNPSLNTQLPPPSFNSPLPPPTFNASTTKSLPAVNRRDVKSMAPTTASIKANFPPPPPSFASSSNFPPPPPSFASSSSFPPPPPSILSNSNNNNNSNNSILNDSSDNIIDHNNQPIKSNSNYIPPPVVIEKPDKKELHRRKVVKNVLSNFLTKRPARETVIEKGILKDDAPELLQRRGTVSSLTSSSGSNSNIISSPPIEEHSSPSGSKVCTNSRCQKKLKSSKNQCRMCQRLFCKNCMNKKAKLPELKINKAVSICDTCFHLKRAIAFEKEKSLNKSDDGAAQ